MSVVRRSDAKDWCDIVTDPEERRVFEALADPRWDLRTVDGLSKSASVPENQVREILRRYPDLVRQAAVLDAEGRELYALASRAMSLREWFSTTRAFMSKTTSSG